MMGFRADLLSVARSALADAQRCPGTEGDKTHAVALERWIGGDPHGAVLVWDIILRDYPRPFRWRSRSISSPIWPSPDREDDSSTFSPNSEDMAKGAQNSRA